MKLFIFNPQHDDAMAHRQPGYVPDRPSKLLADDLALLPMVFASPGDAILVPHRLYESCMSMLPTGVRAVVDDDLPLLPADSQAVAWGWDASVRYALQEAGYCGHMPSSKQVEMIRDISHRSTAARLLSYLREEFSDVVGDMLYLSDEESVRKAIEVPYTTILKAPWSGSGRGLFRAFGEYKPPLSGRVRNVIKTQGGIMVEPYYKCVCNLALEFVINEDRSCDKLGLSLFETAGLGGYAGNILGSYPDLLAYLPDNFAPETLENVSEAVCRILPAIIEGKYVGPLGIDMMIVNREGRMLLHPCVEINSRYTMGHVAVALSKQLVGIKSHLRFSVLWGRGHDELLRNISGKEVVKAFTPLTSETHFYACIERCRAK